MQIEQTFRDTKSHRWGLGLRYGRCNDVERIQVLLLIGALATLMLWLAGLGARALHWTRRFQANTVRARAVLAKPVDPATRAGRSILTRRIHSSVTSCAHPDEDGSPADRIAHCSCFHALLHKAVLPATSFAEARSARSAFPGRGVPVCDRCSIVRE
jgi:hypothetical protein